MSKAHFEASQAVFLSLSCYKELELTIKLFTLYRSYTLQPSDPDAEKIVLACEVWAWV